MKNKLSNIQIIKKVLNLLKQSSWTVKYYSLFMLWIVMSFIYVLEPFFFLRIINEIEEFYKSWSFEYKELITYILFWSSFIIFSVISGFFYRYYIVDKSILNYYSYIFKKYSKKLIYIKYEDFLSNKSWEIYSIFNKWFKDSFNLLFLLFLDVVRSISWVIIIIFLLLYINTLMTLITISMIPFLIYLWYFFNKKTVKLQLESNDIEDRNYWILADSITNTSLVKNLNIEKDISNILDINVDNALKRQFPISKRWSISDVSTQFLVMIARALILITWIYLISIWELSLSLLFFYFSFIWQIYFPISFIFSKLRNIQEQITSIWKFFHVLDDLEKEDLDKWINIEKVYWEIKFRNVGFQYNKWKEIFKNLNFEISPWEKIAFVGNTWAGKSTIVNLIFRLWDINSWEILLDWLNISHINKKSLRKHTWLVAQDNSLFNISIKENLMFAKKDATKEEIYEALKKAEANFVFKLEKWIDTVIWERWLKLSGGERQRLSIARLFLKNPEILVLDEATSALDNKTEKYIHKAIEKIMKWRTSIIIAHRLSTIQNADKIFMMEDWKIVESWNYNELMNKKWKFYELANPDKLLIN